MSKKSSQSIGLEFDQYSIRTAKLSRQKVGVDIAFLLESIEEVRGNFANEETLIAALKKLKSQFGMGRVKVASCLSGKQVYVVQIPFRRMPPNEMKNALLFEIRKNLPFDAKSSSLDYQILEDAGSKGNAVQILVTAVSNALFNRHLRLLERAAIKPDVVDVLPAAIANAFWAGKESWEEGMAAVLLHMGPNMCTVVVNGIDCPFFHRSIYFSTNELFAAESSQSIAEAEKARQLETLGDEVIRSLSFYRQSYSVSGFAGLYLLGEYCNSPELLQVLHHKTELEMQTIDLAKQCDTQKDVNPGKFDVAIALAMREEPEQ